MGQYCVCDTGVLTLAFCNLYPNLFACRFLVELMQPNKSDVLNYIDGDGPMPTRFAHVVLDHRDSIENPHYANLLVGPLPVQDGVTKWEPLTYPYTKKSNGEIRNLDADGHLILFEQFIWPISRSIMDITLHLWNGTALGLANDTLDIFGIDPVWQDDGIIRWETFWNLPTNEFDAETLLPLGLFFKVNVTGRDPSKWKLLGWLWDDIFYETTEEFRTAYWSSEAPKLAPNVEGPWATTDQQGAIMPLDTMYPPTLVAPTGSRFFVDKDQKHVKWMDFEFYMSNSRDLGLKLNDIRYKGKRIIYELGLQEALAHYAGNDPVQSGTSYLGENLLCNVWITVCGSFLLSLDSFYGFGAFSFELINGFDCPSYSTYLNSSFFVDDTEHTHINSICLFEMDAGYPMARHSQSTYVAATKNIFFTVRNVCTVGNYDYQFSYEFYYDGSIHVEVRASGYIQAAYWAKNEDYGYHIHDALSGSMHDHVLNYKVDFDILGTDNTMEIVENVPVSQVYPWSDGKPRNTMKLQRSLVKSEDESKLFWGHNNAKQYKIVNLDARNKFGEPRGYRILPSSPTIHLTVQNSSNLVNAGNWATHDIFVTKFKDTEPRSAYPLNNQDTHAPLIDFSDFFDGENITQTDIVTWFNLGMHHIPHTGDLPNTVFTTAHSGLHILPINYLDRDPSVQTVNRVKVQYGGGKPARVETFGQKSSSCELNFTAAEAELSNYKGDLVVNEFPYVSCKSAACPCFVRGTYENLALTTTLDRNLMIRFGRQTL